jgi:hypothetical protein
MFNFLTTNSKFNYNLIRVIKLKENMDLKRFDSANIRLCTQCSYPFYSDTHKNFFGESCKLCETAFENTKPNFKFKGNLTTKYKLLLDAIRFSIDNHDLNTLLGTNSYPIQNSIGDSNLLEQSRTQWEYLPIKKINLRLSEFDRLEYHGLNRVYSEHNLYEFLLLSNLLLRDNNILEVNYRTPNSAEELWCGLPASLIVAHLNVISLT